MLSTQHRPMFEENLQASKFKQHVTNRNCTDTATAADITRMVECITSDIVVSTGD